MQNRCGIDLQIVILDNLPERHNKVSLSNPTSRDFMLWCPLPWILIVCDL